MPCELLVQQVAERAAIHEKTGARYGWTPVPDMIEMLNEHLRGWANYFKLGYPAMAFRQINRHTRVRLAQHPRRRGQRRYKPPKDVSNHEHFRRLGLIEL